MTDRQKFWLKVVLAVTLPLWMLPAIVVGVALMIGGLFWDAADSIVEPRKSSGRGGGR